jgi:hypothetical protein
MHGDGERQPTLGSRDVALEPFTLLVILYLGAVRAFPLARISDSTDAEDRAQEVFPTALPRKSRVVFGLLAQLHRKTHKIYLDLSSTLGATQVAQS